MSENALPARTREGRQSVGAADSLPAGNQQNLQQSDAIGNASPGACRSQF